MQVWSIKEIVLPLKFPWKISRGDSFVKKNFIVEISGGDVTGSGEVAFNARYNESSELIKDGFKCFLDSCPPDFISLEELIVFLDELDIPSSLRFGIESSFVHFLGVISGKRPHELLGIRGVNSIKTSFTLPIIPVGEIGKFVKDHSLNRFSVLKIKVDSDSAKDSIMELVRNFNGNIRIDANEDWSDPDQVIRLIEKFGPDLPIEFLEQPLPAGFHDEYLYLKKNIEVDLMADESLTTEEVTDYYSERFHAVNVKLMKAGGYLKALSQIRAARELGLKIMLGCMVETSLGISSAMNIAYGVDYFDLDGTLLLKDDPFSLVCEENGKLFYSHLQ